MRLHAFCGCLNRVRPNVRPAALRPAASQRSSCHPSTSALPRCCPPARRTHANACPRPIHVLPRRLCTCTCTRAGNCGPSPGDDCSAGCHSHYDGMGWVGQWWHARHVMMHQFLLAAWAQQVGTVSCGCGFHTPRIATATQGSLPNQHSSRPSLPCPLHPRRPPPHPRLTAAVPLASW